MPVVTWIPKRTTLEEQIAEEEYKLAQLRGEKPWQPEIEPATQAVTPELTEMPVVTPTQKWAPQQAVAPPAVPQLNVGPPTPQWKPEAWEMPKAWAEGAMKTIGEGISKVPVLPDILQWMAPAFEWVHENLERPFAAIVTSPWSTSLPWREGESWLEHEKREYNAWKAPTYVKGIAEFAMPLWWLPWLGWAAKGAKAIGVGNKMARAASRMGESGKLVIPSKEVLNSTLYKRDFFKTVALWAEDKPIIGGVVRAIGGPSAFVRGDLATPIEIVKREIVNRAVIMDMRNGARGLLMPKIQKYGDPVKLLDIDEASGGLVRAIKEKGYLYDVLENPDAYTWTSKQARQYVDDLHGILNEVKELAAKEGIPVPKELTVHRMVTGKTKLTPEGLVKYEASEYGSLFEVARHYKTMEDGVKAGVVYGLHPNESVASTINHYMKKIANKRFTDEVGGLGKTPLQKFATQFPEEAEKIASLGIQKLSAQHALNAITKIATTRGTSMAGATIAKIRRGLPDMAEQLDSLFAIRPREADKLISAMALEIRRVIKIKPREFKVALAQYQRNPEVLRLSEVADCIKSFNIDNATAVKIIEGIYKSAYQTNKQAFKDALKVVQADAKDLLRSSIDELKPLKITRADYLKTYKGVQALGEFEKRFRAHPVFKDKFFPSEVVNMAERALGDKGSQWVHAMGQISGTSRMLVAAMDFSAPFIQGLAVLGRNPVAWLKAVGKQYEFFARPRNLQKYMADPVNMAVRGERVMYGGSSATFEYFEALAPLQKIVGKVPVAGKPIQKLVGQTYGRAEAAFTGFGEVARNEMWKALRRPNMSEAQLREMARTIDRMTGVMSTEALAIGMTQRDFENAFVFFAPRYTRAGLSYVSDVLKGGIAGAEARKSLGALMASGFAMYYGVSTALGQRPNLDPRSPRFLSVKVGDDHIGIGGILYAMIRFGASVVATATEEPLDLVRLNRFDNPFIKFMFNRTAPLTGAITNVIEQKNYFGEPFESPADWGRFMLEKITPIAAQPLLDFKEHPMTGQVFLAEVSGGRTFPLSAWELREDAREKYAQQMFGKAYTDLERLYQNQIDELPEIKTLSEEADRRAIQIGEELSVGFINWQRDRDDARFMYVDRLNNLQRAYDAGYITAYEFREMMQSAGSGLGATYQHVDSRPEYKEVMAKLEEPKNVSVKYIGDAAYEEMMARRYSGEFEDQFGIFQFDKWNEFRESLRRKYGDAVWRYVLEREGEKRKELPPLAQEYYKAQEILKPYWQIMDDMIRYRGEPRTEWQRARLTQIVSRLRKRMRALNPEIAHYIEMFYTRE